MNNKKVPERTCIGCNEKKPKRELVRIVKSPTDEISLDITGKKAGRGCYICKDLKCFEAAEKGHRIEKSFKCKIEKSVYDELREELEKVIESGE